MGFGLGLILLLSGCRSITPIEQAQGIRQPNWFNSTLYLQGSVTQLAPLINGPLYQLQDHTGKIWVLTHGAPVKVGDRLLIQGQVHFEPISITGIEQGEVYIEEQQRLNPDSGSHATP